MVDLVMKEGAIEARFPPRELKSKKVMLQVEKRKC